MTSLLQLELAKQDIDISEIEGLRSIFGAMLKDLEALDTVVTSILEREKTTNTVADVKEENKAEWIGSYHLIERAMRTFLIPYNSVPDTDEHYHLKMLKTFDDETVPLHEALGEKPRPGHLPFIPTARRYIDQLRRLRNAENYPTSENSSTRATLESLVSRIGYLAWYTAVFKSLVQCLKICVEVEKLKKYVGQAGGLLLCSADAPCGPCFRHFKTYAKWKVHALREHPEVFKITGTADKASSSQVPIIPPKTAFDVARTYLGEAIRAATLAAQYFCNTVDASKLQQPISQMSARPGSVNATEEPVEENKGLDLKKQELNIPSSQSALAIMVSEHEAALRRIAGLELELARSKEDVDCGKLREMSLAEKLEYTENESEEFRKMYEEQEKELLEAKYGKEGAAKEKEFQEMVYRGN
ncbi:MAG: hypothetical protein Q9208_000014 [Pyrenodesmia sp. 3 TL-2023]